MKYFIRYIFIAIFLWSAPAHTAQPCQNPAGDEGDQVYNITYHVMQYCNGSHWVAMGSVMNTGDNLGNHTATQDISMDGNKITNLSAPTANTDGASKEYVDTVIASASGGGGCYVSTPKTLWSQTFNANGIFAYSTDNCLDGFNEEGVFTCLAGAQRNHLDSGGYARLGQVNGICRVCCK